MPMHDWTRTPAGDWHDMQVCWVAALAGQLNQTLPPDQVYALIEFNEAPLDSTRKFDIPKIAFDTRDEEALYVRRRRTIALRRCADHAKIGLIEILSPGLKRDATALAAFIKKLVTAIRRGFSVLLIDPFPPTALDPKGLHATVWKELTGESFTPPDGKPLTLASYVARGANTFTAHVEPLAVGDRLPDMPLFLSDEYDNKAPLEETYQMAWHGYPAQLRKVVEG